MSKITRIAQSQLKSVPTPLSSPVSASRRSFKTYESSPLSTGFDNIEYEGVLDRNGKPLTLSSPHPLASPKAPLGSPSPHFQMSPKASPLPGSRAAPLDPQISISVANQSYDSLRGLASIQEIETTSAEVANARHHPSTESSTYTFPTSTPVSSVLTPSQPRSIPGACSMTEIMECVVKIFVTSSSPNYLQPWQTKPMFDSTGSGFIVRGKRIITNAHVVADAVQVMVRKPGSPNKYVANVIASGHECDLALLEVEDDEFWEFHREEAVLDFENVETNGVEANSIAISSQTHEQYQNTQNTQHQGEDGKDVSTYDNIMNIFNGDPAQPLTIPTKSSLSDVETAPIPTSQIPIEGPRIPWSSSVFAPDNHLLIGENAQTYNATVASSFVKDPQCLYLSREVPLLQESVVVVGYPMGGDNLCITQGVVSRVEPVHYAHSGNYLLAIQIDAAINPGNSGGPALVNGRIVGVAFQNVVNASSIGYIIPCSVVLHFLKDVERGGYRVKKNNTHTNTSKRARMAKIAKNKQLLEKSEETEATGRYLSPPSISPDGSDAAGDGTFGFCSLGIGCQETFNPSLQRHVGMLGENNRIKYDSEKSPFTRHLSPDRKRNTNNNTNTNSGLDKLSSKMQTLTISEGETQPVASDSTNITNLTDTTHTHTHTQVMVPDNTPAAYLHYSSVILSDQHVDTRPMWKTKEVRVGKDHLSGVLLLKIGRTSPARGVLERGDIITAIDGIPVASDCSVNFRGNGQERLGFDYLFSLKHAGDVCRITYLRRDKSNGEYKLGNANITMKPLPALVPTIGYDKPPQYLVYGGLVFVPLNIPYMLEFGRDWASNAPRELVDLTQQSVMFDTQQAVVLSQVLPDTTTVGYNIIDSVCKAVDGVMVKNLLHLKQILSVRVGAVSLKLEALSLIDELGLNLVNVACGSSDYTSSLGEIQSECEEAVERLCERYDVDVSSVNVQEKAKELGAVGAELLARYLQLITVLQSSGKIEKTNTSPETSTVTDADRAAEYSNLMYKYNVVYEACLKAKFNYDTVINSIANLDAPSSPSLFSDLLTTDNPMQPYVATKHLHPTPLQYVYGEDDLLLNINSEYLNQNTKDVLKMDGVSDITSDSAIDVTLSNIPTTPTTTTTSTTTTPPSTSTTTSLVCGHDNKYNKSKTAFTSVNSHLPSLDTDMPIAKETWEFVFGPIKSKSTDISTENSTQNMSETIDSDAIHINDTLVFELGDSRTIILDVIDITAGHDDICHKHNIPKDEYIAQNP